MPGNVSYFSQMTECRREFGLWYAGPLELDREGNYIHMAAHVAWQAYCAGWMAGSEQ